MEASDSMANDPAKDELLVLVDALDRQLGSATKERVHREGLLHRAFSVVIWREGPDGPELLLARRAEGKYHSAGLWANSCCSHPRTDERLFDAVRRRIREELGCEATDLHEIGTYVYRAELGNGLVEYEYDHVMVARCVSEPSPSAEEVGAVRWASRETVATELSEHPESFCAWAPGVLSMALRALLDGEADGL